jgi:predicted acylesterase/phospholipase RssA
MMQDEEVLVDGGVMNNFPVDIMAKLIESEHILGVHANPHRTQKKTYSLNGGISGWKILLSRISPFSKRIRVPSLTGTILRTLEINSLYRGKAEQELADLILKPDLRQFGILDFDDYEAIIDAGYKYAKEPLNNWRTNLGAI